jgi:hypothetical protein
MYEGMRLWRQTRHPYTRDAAVPAGRPPCVAVNANVSPVTSVCCCGRHCAPRGANVAMGPPLAQDAPM